MDVGIIFQVLVGLGVCGGMWRLTREVATLNATLKFYIERSDDHEGRIRKLESGDGP